MKQVHVPLHLSFYFTVTVSIFFKLFDFTNIFLMSFMFVHYFFLNLSMFEFSVYNKTRIKLEMNKKNLRLWKQSPYTSWDGFLVFLVF